MTERHHVCSGDGREEIDSRFITGLVNHQVRDHRERPSDSERHYLAERLAWCHVTRLTHEQKKLCCAAA